MYVVLQQVRCLMRFRPLLASAIPCPADLHSAILHTHHRRMHERATPIAGPPLLVQRNALGLSLYAVEDARYPGPDSVPVESIGHFNKLPMPTQALSLLNHSSSALHQRLL